MPSCTASNVATVPRRRFAVAATSSAVIDALRTTAPSSCITPLLTSRQASCALISGVLIDHRLCDCMPYRAHVSCCRIFSWSVQCAASCARLPGSRPRSNNVPRIDGSTSDQSRSGTASCRGRRRRRPPGPGSGRRPAADLRARSPQRSRVRDLDVLAGLDQIAAAEARCELLARLVVLSAASSVASRRLHGRRGVRVPGGRFPPLALR